MQSDLELRAWLAEHLANLADVRIVPGSGVTHFDGKYTKWVPAYEATWEGVGLVVEAMRKRPNAQSKNGWHWRFCAPFMPGELWFAGLTPSGCSGWNGRPDIERSGETLPLAAAKAARAAIEAEKQDG